jgi:hypothetical protein
VWNAELHQNTSTPAVRLDRPDPCGWSGGCGGHGIESPIDSRNSSFRANREIGESYQNSWVRECYSPG